MSEGLILAIFGGLLLAIQGSLGYVPENAQLRVPRSLVECYENAELLDRENRPPSTITTLIDLIRKVENSQEGSNMDMRQLSSSLIHRFRQDGIIQAPGVSASPSVLPYSPADFQFSKHRILLSRLIPNNAPPFPNNTLNATERCSLHFMLSSSIDNRIRGDEGQRCSQLSQYRAMRIPREVKGSPESRKSNFLGDVEVIENLNANIKTKPSKKFGKMSDDPDYDDDIEQPFGTDIGLIDQTNIATSQCPVENGVIWTPWGAVNAGNLIAGIAAGLQPQKVQLRTLLALARRPGASPQQMDATVDNRWAATLAGDLAEVALIQAPMLQNNGDVSIGASGAWNSTTVPRWHFLSKRERLEFTDSEIRGGLDGLIIAMKIQEWKDSAPSMKLSQLLEMYYSQKGVLNSGIRACDRRKLYTTVLKADDTKPQTNSFANVLDREILLRVTLYPEAIRNYSIKAAEALSIYIPQSLNDLSCEATSPTPNDPTDWRTATDLFVFVDTTWPVREINAMLGHIWSNIQVSPIGSRVTVLNANDGKVIINPTVSASELFWNFTVHEKHPVGLNLPNVLKTASNLSLTLMNNEKIESTVGGRSLIALIVVQNAAVNEADASFAAQSVQMLREQVPDLKLLFLANGAVNRFARFVKDEAKDLFVLGTGDNYAAQMNPVIKRIREIPRRIINPRCGRTWHAENWGLNKLSQVVGPDSVNYYRIHPNYFFGEGKNRKLRIRGTGGPSITVCRSRQIELPRSNGTQNDGINCQQLISQPLELNLDNSCEGHAMIHQCPPFYISVEAKNSTGASQARCRESICVRPDDVSYTIEIENFGCYSNVKRTVGNFAVIALIFSTLRIFN